MFSKLFYLFILPLCSVELSAQVKGVENKMAVTFFYGSTNKFINGQVEKFSLQQNNAGEIIGFALNKLRYENLYLLKTQGSFLKRDYHTFVTNYIPGTTKGNVISISNTVENFQFSGDIAYGINLIDKFYINGLLGVNFNFINRVSPKLPSNPDYEIFRSLEKSIRKLEFFYGGEIMADYKKIYVFGRVFKNINNAFDNINFQNNIYTLKAKPLAFAVGISYKFLRK